MGILIGMDEAGYGPNLGPLVVTVTVWEVPGDPRKFDLAAAMSDVAQQTPSKDPLKLHVADSKQVYSPGRGLASLEKSVLSAFRLLERRPATLRELSQILAPSDQFASNTRQSSVSASHQRELFADETLEVKQSASRSNQQSSSQPPWLVDRELALPTEVDQSLIGDIATKWAACCQRAGVRLLDMRSEVVQPERFNALVRAANSKGVALSRLSLSLLRSVWDVASNQPTLVICDKHGGRNQYSDLLNEVLDGQTLQRIVESRERSVYQVGSTELRFQMQAEQHFPVALASLVCKYVRELSMDLFNQFWSEHVPGLKRTAGYPLDALRYKKDIAAAQTQLAITNDVLWRER